MNGYPSFNLNRLPSNSVLTLIYDTPTGLITQKLYADGKGTSYTYTPDGRLATRTWARGVLASYTYDETGALVAVVYSDDTPSISYAYNRIGQMTSAISKISTNLFTYSPTTLQLESEAQNGTVITRHKDVFGRNTGYSLDGTNTVIYGYDELGRFSSVSSACSVAYYSYQENSDLISDYTIGDFNRAIAYEPHRDLITAVSNLWDHTLISAYDYTNDEVGRRITRLDSGLAFAQPQSNLFGYNERSEVISAIMHTNAYGYVYDPIGNRLVSSHNAETNTYTANSLNQYTQIDTPAVPSHEPTYDADGNMTNDGKEWHYVWDGENRLLMSTPSSLATNGSIKVSYKYNYRNLKIAQITERLSGRGAE